MKLELKHLAPYLPYGLKGKALHLNNECVLSGLGKRLGKTFDYQIKSGSGFITRTAGLSNFKPILRPLSDLTKENDVFVNLEIGFLGLNNLKEHSNVLGVMLHRDVSILIENHFDVFGLIEKGLAIDINTLEL